MRELPIVFYKASAAYVRELEWAWDGQNSVECVEWA